MIENIKTTFPDSFGIKDMLRHHKIQNPEFLDLTLKSYDILLHLKNQKLSITESLKINKNVSIFDHQIFAAQKIKNEFGGTAMLSDEVGLGKTIEAAIIIKEFLTTGLAKKVLILAPPSLLPQWQDELASKFNLDFINQQGDLRFTGVLHHNLLIMSHASAISPHYSDALKMSYWDLVIVDEAHSMKNSQTLKHKLVKNLPKRNLLLLTATPLQNNLEELYNLVELLHPGYLGTWKQFKSRYVQGIDSRTVNPIFKDELQKILSELIIRTTRKEVRSYIKFTDRIPHTEILEPTLNEIHLYDNITDIVRNLYSNNHSMFALMIYQRLASSSTKASKIALYKMMMNKIITQEKYHELIILADNILVDSKLSNLLKVIERDSSKFLIFTEFHATQDYIVEYLQNKGYSVTLFNGKLTLDQKRDSIKQFRGDIQIMVSTSAGGEGQNFQFCHNIVNYDLPWNPMKVEQRIGRVHRIGQTHDVHIFNYALKGTIEGYILELLYTKIKLFQMALGDMDLIFEDSWSGGSSQTWFKEYMNTLDEKETQNKFSALGDDWSQRRKEINDVIIDFNNEVFANFDLSVLKENAK